MSRPTPSIYDGEGLLTPQGLKATGKPHPVDPRYRAITVEDLMRAAAARKGKARRARKGVAK
jgi:hypothetical protein